MNEFTLRAFNILKHIDKSKSSPLDEITHLIHQSKDLILASREKSAIDLQVVNDAQETLLDIALTKKLDDIFVVLCDYLTFQCQVKDKPLLAKQLLISCLCNLIYQAETNPEQFHDLIKILQYDISMKGASSFAEEGFATPLMNAIKTGNQQLTLRLLLCGADPELKDGKKLRSPKLQAELTSPELLPLLRAATKIKHAINAFQFGNLPAFYSYFYRTCDIDLNYVTDYLQLTIERANEQQHFRNEDKHDYRYVLGMVKALVFLQHSDEAVRSELDKELVQLDIIQPLFAYDIEANPDNPHRLFCTYDEKQAYLTQPLVSALIEGAIFEKTVYAMPAKKSEVSASQLSESMSSSGIISDPSRQAQEKIIRSASCCP